MLFESDLQTVNSDTEKNSEITLPNLFTLWEMKPCDSGRDMLSPGSDCYITVAKLD